MAGGTGALRIPGLPGVDLPERVKAPPKADPLNALWFAQGKFGLAKSIFDSVIATMPQFMHAVTVTAVGGPQADLRRVWFLACSIAFGRIRRSPALNGGSAQIKATWDITAKVAQIELVYMCAKMTYSEDVPRPSRSLSTLFDNGESVAGMAIDSARATTPKKSPLIFIQTGPDQLTIGGGWPDFLLRGATNQKNTVRTVTGDRFIFQVPPVVPQFVITTTERNLPAANVLREWPTTAFLPWQVTAPRGLAMPVGTQISDAGAPTLPDDGRVITSGEKSDPFVQPPRPLIDGTTRSHLIALVAAALATPCVLPESPPITDVPTYGTGFYVYSPGEANNLNGTNAAIAANQANARAKLLSDKKPDGYDALLSPTAPDYRSE